MQNFKKVIYSLVVIFTMMTFGAACARMVVPDDIYTLIYKVGPDEADKIHFVIAISCWYMRETNPKILESLEKNCADIVPFAGLINTVFINAGCDKLEERSDQAYLAYEAAVLDHADKDEVIRLRDQFLQLDSQYKVCVARFVRPFYDEFFKDL